MKTAKIISIIGHPIFLPTWMMAILLLSGITHFSPNNNWIYLTITFSTTCLIPALVIIMMKRWNLIKSVEMESRDERLGPLLIMIMFIYATLKFFNKIPIFSFFTFYMTTTAVVTVLAFLITLFWKISLHTIGWGSFVACLFVMTTVSVRLYLPYFIGGIIIAGIVAAARLQLHSHNSQQIYTGFATGFATVIIMYFLLLV